MKCCHRSTNDSYERQKLRLIHHFFIETLLCITNSFFVTCKWSCCGALLTLTFGGEKRSSSPPGLIERAPQMDGCYFSKRRSAHLWLLIEPRWALIGCDFQPGPECCFRTTLLLSSFTLSFTPSLPLLAFNHRAHMQSLAKKGPLIHIIPWARRNSRGMAIKEGPAEHVHLQRAHTQTHTDGKWPL